MSHRKIKVVVDELTIYMKEMEEGVRVRCGRVWFRIEAKGCCCFLFFFFYLILKRTFI